MSSLRGLFKPDIKYQVVEVDKPRELAHTDLETRKSVASLALHPGFRYLLAKLKTQKKFLEGQLISTPHTSIRDVHQLQAGIFWCGWLDSQLKYETALSEPKLPVSATQEELDAFAQVNAQLEIVGQ